MFCKSMWVVVSFIWLSREGLFLVLGGVVCLKGGKGRGL